MKKKLVKISTSVLGLTHLSPDVWYAAKDVSDTAFSISTSNGPMNVSKSDCIKVKDMTHND